MEILNKDTEIKIIYETDEEAKKIPILICKLKETIGYGWGGVRATVQTNSNGTKHIFIRKWEDER